MTQPPTLHLSFHPAQADQAASLRAHLLAAGCTLATDPAQAHRVILLLSQLWMDEIWPGLADDYAAPAQRDRLLPLLAQPCALPPWLARLRPLDFTQPQEPNQIVAQIFARLARRTLARRWQVGGDGDAQGQDRVLRGHADFVTGVALLGDGAQIVSASQDGSLILWDGESGRALGALSGHRGAVLAVAVDPAGRAIFSAGRDGTLRHWVPDGAGGWQTDHTWPIPATTHTLAVTPDGRFVVMAAQDAGLMVLDLAGDHMAVHDHLHGDWVRAVAVLPQDAENPGPWLAVSAGDDRALAVWEVDTGALRQRWPEAGGQAGGFISALAGLPQGRVLAGSDDRTVAVWEVTAGRVERTLRGHAASVRSVAVTPDGRRAISAGNDGGLMVWDVAAGRAVEKLDGHVGAVGQVALTPDGRWAVSASTDTTLRRWRLDGVRPTRTAPQGHRAEITALALSPSGDRLISAAEDGRLLVWDAATGATLGEAAPRFPILSLAVTASGDKLLAASEGGGVEVWALPLGESPLRTLSGRGAILCVAASPGGRTVAGGSVNWAIKLWDLAPETAGTRPDRILRGHRGGVTALAFMPDGRLLSGDEVGVLRVWDGTEGVELAHWPVGADPITAIAPVTGQPWAIIGGEGTTPRLINLESGAILAEFAGHTDWILGLGTWDQGRILVTGGDDASLRLWDVASGSEVGREDLPHPLANLVVDAEKNRLFTGDTEGRLTCFDLIP